MGEADGIDDRHHLVGLAHLADQLGDAHELVLRNAADARHHLRRVARVVLLHELEYRLRILQRHVALGDCGDGPTRRRMRFVIGVTRGGIDLIAPGGDVVLAGGGIVAAEEPVLERVVLFHQEGGVGVVDDIFLVIEVVLQDVIDQPAEVGDIGAGADARVDIGHRRGPGEARIGVDDLGAAA